jgi:hypothetical protein
VFPQQAHDLAKEIAAFATSNTGIILLGVADDGTLIGLEGMEDGKQRDQLLKRLEGICNGSIRPAVTPTAAWAVESQKIVLVVVVPKGSEPLYYTNSRPYLRHISSSRPAEPHEVIDLVRRHIAVLATSAEPANSQDSALYNDLANVLIGILLWTEIDSDERWVNPWLREWMAESQYAARTLRDLASVDTAIQLGVHARMLELATALQDIADFTVTLGSGHELIRLNERVQTLAKALKEDTVDKLLPDAGMLTEAKRILTRTLRKLTELSGRAEQAVFSGSVEQVQAECGEIGTQLMRLSFYNLDALKADFSKRVRAIGSKLRLLGIERIYMDGGDSLRKIVEGVRACQRALQELIADFSDNAAP